MSVVINFLCLQKALNFLKNLNSKRINIYQMGQEEITMSSNIKTIFINIIDFSKGQ